MRISLLFIMILLIHTAVFSQKKAAQKKYKDLSKFYMSFGGGAVISTHKTSVNTPVEGLLTKDAGGAGKVASLTYFVYKRFGLEASIFVNDAPKQDSLYEKQISKLYRANYFITYPYSTPYDAGTSLKLLIGPVFKIPIRRFLLVPKLLIGGNYYTTLTGAAYLKKIEGNEKIDITYTPLNESKFLFLVAPSLMVSYRLFKRIGINIEANYFCSTYRDSYIETTHNYALQKEVTVSYPVKAVLNSVGISGGISFLFK